MQYVISLNDAALRLKPLNVSLMHRFSLKTVKHIVWSKSTRISL